MLMQCALAHSTSSGTHSSECMYSWALCLHMLSAKATLLSSQRLMMTGD